MESAQVVYVSKAVDLSDKPPVTKMYAAKWFKRHFDTITAWTTPRGSEPAKLKTDENGLIPVSELFRLESELNK